VRRLFAPDRRAAAGEAGAARRARVLTGTPWLPCRAIVAPTRRSPGRDHNGAQTT